MHGGGVCVFCKFLYLYISQYLRGNTQYRHEQLPPLSQLLSWKPEKDGTKMLQRCICPAAAVESPQQLLKVHTSYTGHTVLLCKWPPQPLWNLGYTASHIHWSHLHELSWNTSLPPSYGSYLLLGNKPTFSVDFRVTKEGICFSSWIFNRIGCRTPQNMDKMPSINGLLPSCWEKKKKA